MPKAKPDWDKIKAEYLTGSISGRKISEKYGVPYKTFRNHAEKEHWSQDRAHIGRKTDDKLIESISDAKADEAAVFLEIIHAANVRLLAAVTNGDTAEAKAVSALARAIKELGSVQGFVFGDYDKREREARIAALQARTEKDDGPDEIRLVIEGEGYEQS